MWMVQFSSSDGGEITTLFFLRLMDNDSLIYEVSFVTTPLFLR